MMSEKEKKILDTFEVTVPKLNDLEKEKLLSFGEGMAFMADRRVERRAESAHQPHADFELGDSLAFVKLHGRVPPCFPHPRQVC